MAPKGITASAVYRVIARRAAAAGVADLSPHGFRRTFVGDLLEQGHDRSTVQRRAGHAAPTTTARYDRRGEAPQARATADLPFPTGPDDAPETGGGCWARRGYRRPACRGAALRIGLSTFLVRRCGVAGDRILWT